MVRESENPEFYLAEQNKNVLNMKRKGNKDLTKVDLNNLNRYKHEPT